MHLRLGRMLAGILLVAGFGLGLAGAAEQLPVPGGEPILTVTGRIQVMNGDGRAEFDRDMLEKLGTVTLATSTPWTEGQPVFEGVSASTLLDAVGAEGTMVTAIALNDYRVQLPISDFRRYPVLLATKMNGMTLRIRDKGPVWIIYPRDDFPELANDAINQRWIWQLKELHVE